MARPEDILSTYEEHADGYARARDRGGDTRPVEAAWLDRLLEHRAVRPKVLDVGCGPGVPIARYLMEQGCAVTGVDGAARMVELFARNVPGARAHHMDMRSLELGTRFGALVAWDSFFHLGPRDQEQMFGVFARHCAPGARLLFTSGADEGVAVGEVEGQPVYHSSQAPETYRLWLTRAGFSVVAFVPDDATCGHHSVWLAQREP